MKNLRDLYTITYVCYTQNCRERNANKFVRCHSVWGLEEARKFASEFAVIHAYNGVGEMVKLV